MKGFHLIEHDLAKNNSSLSLKNNYGKNNSKISIDIIKQGSEVSYNFTTIIAIHLGSVKIFNYANLKTLKSSLK